MNLFLESIKLLRPINVLLGGATVIVCAIMIDGLSEMHLIIKGLIIVMAFTGGANALNDYFDLDIDKINKKNRPLVRGYLTPKFALNLSVVLYGLGIVVASLTPKPALIISVGIALPLILAYNLRLKGTILFGNLAVSLIIAITFLFSGSLFNALEKMILPAFLAFSFTFVREFIKDMADEKGDREMGLNTLPVKLGLIASAKVAIGMISLLLFVIILPYVMGFYNKNYLFISLIGIGIPLAYIISLLIKMPSSNNCIKASRLLKVCTLIGLIAIYIG
ncbi:MAG: geranylgeranylglycerol-phosphate geranylgeranyltransferase [Candidatus Neomarinimicrobiota bacterium]